MTFFAHQSAGLNEEDSRSLLRSVLWWSLATSAITSLLSLLLTGLWHFLPLVLLPNLVQIAVLLALRRWPVGQVGALYLGFVSLMFLLGAVFDRGIGGQAYYGLVLVVQAAALLFGTRGLVVSLPVVTVIGLILISLELNGGLRSAPERPLLAIFLTPLGAFFITGVGSRVIHQRLAMALARAQAEAKAHADSNERLSREIERRHQVEHDLQQSMRQVLEASRLKSTFLANVSHELRTPMNSVVGLTDLLLTDDELPPKQRDALETIRSSSDSLLSLLDDILDLSKIEAGAVTFEVVPTPVATMVEDVRKLLAAKAAARGIGLRTELSAELPPVLGVDPTRLRQVILNLVGNAVKFTPSGEVVVGAGWANGRLTLTVRDTGIGIRPDQLERIFQPFVQADAGTTRRFGGTGLGLAIVHRLVDAQGGAVTVESAEGVGSTFTVILPAPLTGDSVTPSPPRTTVKVDASLEGLSVLLAEDNPINEKVALRLLESLGAGPIAVAHDGNEAIELAQGTRFDVVLMDIQMPGVDGLEATKQLRARHGAALPIVAMTANAMPEDRARARDAGCDDFLAKPVRLNELHAALVRVARRREPRGG